MSHNYNNMGKLPLIPLTKKQAALIDFIYEFEKKHGRWLMANEYAEIMDKSPNSSVSLFNIAKRKGWLRQEAKGAPHILTSSAIFNIKRQKNEER